MKTIWKYELRSKVTKLLLHEEAEVLSVAVQNQSIMMWVRQDFSRAQENRTFCRLNTGEPHDYDLLRFIGTVHLEDGTIVVHVFEMGGLDG